MGHGVERLNDGVLM